jgi:hypothetical protein
MSLFASVASYQIVSGSLMIPLIGAWTADLSLAGEETVSGTVPVVIGNLTLTGTVFRSESYGGQTKVRLVGGYGGWRTPIQPQGYGSSNGIQLSTLLGDAAQACGEKLNVAASVSIGNGYARCAFGTSVAGDLLWHMIDLGFIPSWYVDPTGMTQVQTWPSSAVTTPFTPTAQHPDQGMIEVATEDYVSWMPGCTFSSPLLSTTYTSSGVHYVWDDAGKFRFEVLTQTSQTDTGDRVLGPIQQIIQKEMAPTRFSGKYRYTISNPSKTTIDCSPKNTKLGLPDLQSVPLMSDSISTYTPPDGGDCIIEFLDGYIPICTWTAQTPTIASILGGTNPVARLGDQVQIFFPPVVPFTALVPPPPSSGTLTIVSPLTGVITQGSQTVNTA